MNNFKEKLKLYFKKRTQRISLSGLSVVYDWYFILFCGIIFTLIGLVMAIFSYRDISNGSVFEGSDTPVESNASQSKSREIEEVVNYLRQR